MRFYTETQCACQAALNAIQIGTRLGRAEPCRGVGTADVSVGLCATGYTANRAAAPGGTAPSASANQAAHSE